MRSSQIVRVYVAGPYTRGVVAQNVRAAIDVADHLLRLGYVPFCPHLTFFWDMVHKHSWQEWMDYDLHWVRACDVTFRIDGESTGADMEVRETHLMERPVVYSIGELQALFPLEVAEEA